MEENQVQMDEVLLLVLFHNELVSSLRELHLMVMQEEKDFKENIQMKIN